jgi:2'-5' RNA ligase
MLAEEGRGLFLRWVRPESVHLTLRFWSDLQADAVPAVCEGLQRAAEGSAPFLAAVGGLGCFPNADRPRVLWMGLEDTQRQWLQLRRQIDASLAAEGVPAEEKPFRPHLTVARVRRAPERGKLDAFLDAHKNQAFGDVAVSQIHLMRSDLSGKGAVHTCLHSFLLQGDKLAAQSPLGVIGERV